jgi:putative hydrolase of the HAD superfamily
MIRAITFDLWNTLLVEKSFTERRLTILAEALDIEGQQVYEEDLERAYAAAQRRHNELWSKEYCHYPLAERLDDILREVKATLSPTLRKAVMDKFGDIILDDPPSLTEGAADTVARLSTRFKLGIISDTGVTSGSKIKELLDEDGIMRYFTSTVFSDETGICKPRREAFDQALKDLGAKADEAIHVGDLLRTDVAGAKAAGMKAVWIRIREPDAEGVTPDYTITRLSELLKILEIAERL